jgi:membrane protein DedA with SNARE-associated domain/rhodanese-related sulfurtransferase
LGAGQLIELPPTAIATWGSTAVFANVLLTRLGVPVPAIPVLIFAGSAIASGTLSFTHVLAAAVLAALTGDGMWFMAGRIYGRRLIHGLARHSLSVDTSLRTMRRLFERFGLPIVAVSKFIPGLALITPPFMGTTRIAVKAFAAWDAAGTVAWASFWLLGGAMFEKQLTMLLLAVEPHGWTIVDVLVIVALSYLAYRYVQRWRARKWLTRIYVSPERLRDMMNAYPPPVILEARQASSRREEPWIIPGASLANLDRVGTVNATLLARTIVAYCDCPNDAAARMLCGQLQKKGFLHIHALKGGLNAWVRRGYPVEPLPSQLTEFTEFSRHR